MTYIYAADGEGLEDSDVLEEKHIMEKDDLTQLCKDNTLVIRLVAINA